MITDKTNRTIFKLLQAALFSNKENIDFDESVDWNSVLKEMRAHTVDTVVCEAVVNNLNIPADIRQKWTNLTLSQVTRWTKIMSAQEEFINLMHKNNIEIAIIKGSAAAILYPHPEYRPMGDVDFIVKKENFSKACQLMLDNGYEWRAGEETGMQHMKEERYAHTEMKKDGVTFEIHKSFAEMLKDGKEESLFNHAEEALDNLEINKLQEYDVPMFSKELNGLILLRHIVHHIREKGCGLGLRQILDWMIFVEKYVDDNYWKKEFEAIVTNAGLKTVAVTFTRMCQIYLGLREENVTWCMNADENLCKEWLEIIMDMGNFGKKRGENDLGFRIILKNENIFTFLKSLQKNGEINWKLTGRRTMLKPFAWLYQICRYFKKAFTRKSPFKTLRNDFSRSKEMKEMIEKLEIDSLMDIW